MLAAGDGGRLGHHTASLPKPLVILNGRRLIDYTIEALESAGVDELVVVTGYRGDQLREALRARAHRLALSFVENPRYEGGASLSLLAAREATHHEPFLLVMSDHVFSAPLIRALIAAAGPAGQRRCVVAADYGAHSPGYIDEATKLGIDAQGLVTAIGKSLPHWQALDAGGFVLTPEVWDAAASVAAECELSVIFSELARRRQLFAADITGAFWYDIDTEGDLAEASALLRRPGPPSPIAMGEGRGEGGAHG